MLADKQIKTLGLRFARSLQTAVKTAIVFSAEHQSVERPVQQTFQLLNSLLKEAGQLTFGFIDNQIILNNVLTSDNSLEHLQKEFLKRGIAAVTFEPGLTLSRFKRVVNVLAASTKAIEGSGGILPYLDANLIEGTRFILAAKNQKKNEDGDTIIETSSEDYILAKQSNAEQAPRDFLESMESLLEAAGYDPSARGSALSQFAQFDGSGYGVPIAMPNLGVIRDGVVNEGTPGGEWRDVHPGSTANDAINSAEFSTQSERTMRAAAGSPVGESGLTHSPQGGQGWIYQGPSSGLEGESDSGSANGGSPRYVSRWGRSKGEGRNRPAGTDSFIELMENAVERSLLEEKGDPQKSCAALTRVLRTVGVDKLLHYFPPERRKELGNASPEQLAAEYMEDTALWIAGSQLSAKKDDKAQYTIVEEDVARLLARSLKATHKADRLAQKLGKFIQEFAIPPHVQEKIRSELRWTSLNNAKKIAHLMETSKFSSLEFRHLTELVKELVAAREVDQASALVTHYFDFLDTEAVVIDPTDLSRAPELIRTIPLARAGFVAKTMPRLIRTLLRNDISDLIHLQAANALTVLAQSIAAFEDFEDVLTIGNALERSQRRDLVKHENCCSKAIRRLIPEAAVERIIEMFLLQRDDSAWARTSATLLRFATPTSIERVFAHLIDEQDARNRLALLRLATQLGPGAIDVARKYLLDNRWYVVRNTCGILAELKDPELGVHILPALRHKDIRVKESAFRALTKSRSADRGVALARALPDLPPNLLDNALDELTFLKDSGTVNSLENFIFGNSKPVNIKKAVQVLTGIGSDEALVALARILNKKADMETRRIALNAISRSSAPLAQELLKEFRRTNDPLARESGHLPPDGSQT